MEKGILIVRTVAGIAGLGGLCMEDIKRKELSVPWIFLFGLLGVLLSIAAGEWQNPGVLLRFLPGVICLVFGRISRESIGYGDGLVILGMGGYLTWSDLMGVCLAAISMAGMAALFLLLVKRLGRKTRIPFVPFLFAGYGVWLLCQGGGF